MKCYRVYYKDELLGTFFDIKLAVMKSDEFINAGFSDIHIEIEKY